MVILGNRLQSNGRQRVIGCYLIVGLLGTLIDVGLFTALHVVLGVPTLAANTTSYSAGIVNNYVLHRYWTYGGRSRKAVGVQFVQFTAVSLSALAVNNLLVLLLAPQLGTLLASPAYGDLMAKACATAVGLCWNYLANNFWTFGDVTMKGAQ